MSSHRAIEAAKRLSVNADFGDVLQKRLGEEIDMLLNHDPQDIRRITEILTRYHALNELSGYVEQLARETADG